MKSVRKRHSELSPTSPHKLMHTGAVLVKQAGISLETILEAPTYSNKEVIKTYVNTIYKVNKAVEEIVYRNLFNTQGINRI